jgi:hypothetical protein
MDGTRDRAPERIIDEQARSGVARRSAGATATARRDGAGRHVSMVAAAPVAAPDRLIEVGEPAPPAIAETIAVPQARRVQVIPAGGEAPRAAAQRRSRALAFKRAPALAAGALAILVLVAIGLLLWPSAQPEATPTVAQPEGAAAIAAAVAAPAGPTVHLRLGTGLAPEARAQIEAALAAAGYDRVLVHEMPFRISRSRVGYFRAADRAEAEALIAALRGTHDGLELRDYGALVATPEPGRLDLWIRS